MARSEIRIFRKNGHTAKGKVLPLSEMRLFRDYGENPKTDPTRAARLPRFALPPRRCRVVLDVPAPSSGRKVSAKGLRKELGDSFQIPYFLFLSYTPPKNKKSRQNVCFLLIFNNFVSV